MKQLFWFSLSWVLLAYAGYPLLLCFRAKLWPRPVKRGSIFPTVTIVLAVHNEGKSLPGKLQNLAAMDYPADRLQVIVVSDGSTDATNGILAAWQGVGRRAVILQEHRGKAVALNRGVAEAQGEIVVFADARQVIAPDALRNLVADFADPSIGCVSGALIMRKDRNAPSAQGVTLYWEMEKRIRNWEGLVGSTIGATGALYGVRRDLVSRVPEGTILDDVYIPLDVVRQGYRAVFEPRALAWDPFIPNPKQEFLRKLRTLVGNYQLLRLAPWVLTDSSRLRFQFICHKMLRLFVPFALMGLLISAFCIRTSMYELALILQLAFYSLAALSLFRSKFGIVSRLSDISLAFIVMNSAAAVAFVYFITGREVAWGGDGELEITAST